jgi:aryl carrier-like protein
VDREALPAPGGRPPAGEHAGPRDERETEVCEIWRDVLRRNSIGIHDRFFEAGGDSIKAIQIVSRLRSAGYDLEMRDFFEAPTIAGLAAALKAAGANRDHEPAPAQPGAGGQVSLAPEELAELFADD